MTTAQKVKKAKAEYIAALRARQKSWESADRRTKPRASRALTALIKLGYMPEISPRTERIVKIKTRV